MNEIYSYLGIHSNSDPTAGYFPIRGSDNTITISLIDPHKDTVTHAKHGFRCFMIGK